MLLFGFTMLFLLVAVFDVVVVFVFVVAVDVVIIVVAVVLLLLWYGAVRQKGYLRTFSKTINYGLTNNLVNLEKNMIKYVFYER